MLSVSVSYSRSNSNHYTSDAANFDKALELKPSSQSNVPQETNHYHTHMGTQMKPFRQKKKFVQRKNNPMRTLYCSNNEVTIKGENKVTRQERFLFYRGRKQPINL